MSQERDELNRRRRAREEARKKREQAQKRLYFRLAAAAMVLLACGIGIFFLIRDNAPAPDENAFPTISVEQTQPPETEAPTEAASWQKANEVIHLVAAGDLNVTDNTVWAGQEGSTYDYTNAFMDVASIFTEADLALLNFEGTVNGMPYGTVNGSAPAEMLRALKRAGVDLVQMANSTIVNGGYSGLVTTLSNIRSEGIEPVGAFSSTEEFRKSKGYTICEVGDIKIALVAFTKGMGGHGLPEGSEDCVNLLYTDYATTYREIDVEGITAVLRAAENEDPDITIALLHWGSEYNEDISKSQENIRDLMLSNGVDAIIGTHSHLVQKIDFDEASGQLVAYSLGDFFGDAKRSGTQYSIILDLEITKNYDTGITRITDFSYTPIYTLSEADCDGERRVVRIDNAISAYELNFVDKVTKDCYDSMIYALQRIDARVNDKDKK